MKKYIITILCLFALVIYQCEKNKALTKHQLKNIKPISDTISYYINKLGRQTASIKTLELNHSQLKDILLKKDKELAYLATEFNKINHITKYNSITAIDTIKVKFNDTIPCYFKRIGTITRDWYSFDYISTQKGIEIDSLSLPTQTTVITGVKRKWFLGSETVITDITNTNPHIKISEIKAVEIKLTQPWYKKWYIWMIAGAASGWFVAK